MKVAASAMFKGKKASYEQSIPVPFIPHRLGSYLWYNFELVADR